MSGRIISQTKLILSSVASNNNKFWHAIVWEDGTFETKWGRVGVRPTSHTKPLGSVDAAMNELQQKKRLKLKDGYHELAVLMDSESGAISSTALSSDLLGMKAEKDMFADSGSVGPELRELVRSLAKANIHNILAETTLSYNSTSGLFSTPLGLVTQSALDQARVTLNAMAALVASNAYDSADWPELINKYLMLVPRNIGFRKPTPQSMFPELSYIQEHAKVLDALETSVQLATKSLDENEKTKQPEHKAFDVLLTPAASDELPKVKDLYLSTAKTMHYAHNYTPLRVYDIQIRGMKNKFESTGKHVGNIQRLWHGTRVCNLLSILHSGFVIPPSNSPHVTGRMFGNGIYSSNISTKALNYSVGAAPGQHGRGSTQGDNVFMFLLDVAMGKPFIPPGPTSAHPPQGCNSTWAQPKASGVMNDEMIVYDVAQVNLVQLVEFEASRR
jgi:poly [ADP-ribose] polymerase